MARLDSMTTVVITVISNKGECGTEIDAVVRQESPETQKKVWARISDF